MGVKGARWSLRALALASLALSLSAGFPTRSQAELPAAFGAVRVDGLAAVVGGLAPGKNVISIYRSDVELRARLSLLRAGADAAALGMLPNSLLNASLDELVGESLVAAEAARLSLAKPSHEQVQRERQRLAMAAGGGDALASLARAFGVTEGEFMRIAERKAIVSGFLAANLEGTLEISPAELDKAYAEVEHPFEDEPIEAVREQFRAWLIQRRVEAAVGRWVNSLRQRTPLRRLVTY